MPNHCDNSTYIFGPEAEVKKMFDNMFKEDSDGELKFKISNLVQCPEDLKIDAHFMGDGPPSSWEQRFKDGEISKEEYDNLHAKWNEEYQKQEDNYSKYGYHHWYEWCLGNWGTKWGDYDHYYLPTEVTSNGEMAELEIKYMTAWSPFSELFWARVTDEYPNCLIKTTFSEGGMNFLGAIVAKFPHVLSDEDDIDFEWSDDPDDEEYENYLISIQSKVEEMENALTSDLFKELNNNE